MIGGIFLNGTFFSFVLFPCPTRCIVLYICIFRICGADWRSPALLRRSMARLYQRNRQVRVHTPNFPCALCSAPDLFAWASYGAPLRGQPPAGAPGRAGPRSLTALARVWAGSPNRVHNSDSG